jgi:FkbM family methyltransferase
VINISAWIPIASIRPFETFLRRTNIKCKSVGKQLFLFAGLKLGFSGAREVGTTKYGNTILRLNGNSPLGRRGNLIELPRDRIIFESVKNLGSWEIDESKFLAHVLKELFRDKTTKVALVDIGANTGLVSLQAMNLAKTNNDVFLFEPIPGHVSGIHSNLRNLPKIHVNEIALSDRDGEAKIFTEFDNRGNTSLLKNLIPSKGQMCTKVKLVNTFDYFEKNVTGFDSYVFKCDTQGMDALILSRVPKSIWQKCKAAVIEVWALPTISEKDVDELLAMCTDFKYMDWFPNSRKRIDLDEVRSFWLNGSSSSSNLFLRR